MFPIEPVIKPRLTTYPRLLYRDCDLPQLITHTVKKTMLFCKPTMELQETPHGADIITFTQRSNLCDQ